MTKPLNADRLAALDAALAEAARHVKEVGGNNRGPRVDLYQKADNIPGVGYAWCMAFVNWCFQKATGKVLANRTASVGVFRSFYSKHWVTRPLRGDYVCFAFASSVPVDHVGQVVRVLSIRLVGLWYLKTVEGNTSGDSKGSQDDGGGVYIRRRLVRRNRVTFVRVPNGGVA